MLLDCFNSLSHLMTCFPIFLPLQTLCSGERLSALPLTQTALLGTHSCPNSSLWNMALILPYTYQANYFPRRWVSYGLWTKEMVSCTCWWKILCWTSLSSAGEERRRISSELQPVYCIIYRFLLCLQLAKGSGKFSSSTAQKSESIFLLRFILLHRNDSSIS